MSVFFAKISKNDQIESMYSVSSLDFLNGLQVNDYVFPKQNDLTVSKLFKVVSIINNGDVYTVNFKLICEFNPLSLNEFISFSWFKLNVNLLNKVVRSTRNIGYIKLELHNHTETDFEDDFEESINDVKNFRKNCNLR